jgi:predicted branched-subunit amino acid permease
VTHLAPYRAGLKAGVGFALAAFVLGVSFGVLAEPIMGPVAPVVMSAVLFAGASQFGATAVLAAGGDALTAIAAGIMLNARFLPMGVAAATALHGSPLRRAVEGQAVVDASWALAVQGDGRFDRELLIGATIPQYPAWVAGTLIGVITGGAAA